MLEQLAKMSSAPAGAEAKETVELSKQAHAVRLGFKWEDDETVFISLNLYDYRSYKDSLYRKREIG